MKMRSKAFQNYVIGEYDEKYDKPERNLIVTGIPRSGTSLFSTLLNEIPNVYCMNEILYDIVNVPRDLTIVRKHLVEGEPVPNKYKEGKLATNTGTEQSKVTVETRAIHKKFDEDCVVGSNVNLPYLNSIQFFILLGYKIIAVVRDPVYTIASWNSKNCEQMQIHNLMGDQLQMLFWHIPITAKTNVERQAQLWEWYARVIDELRMGNKSLIIAYEDLIEYPTTNLDIVRTEFGLPPTPYPPLLFSNYNNDGHYPDVDIEPIRQAVQDHCPTRKLFGYD